MTLVKRTHVRTAIAFAAAALFTAGAWAAATATAPHPAPARAPAPVRAAPAPAANKAAIEKIVHDYLVAHPEILIEMTSALQHKQEAEAADQQRAQQAAIKQMGLGPLVDPRVAYVVGPANAKVTIVEFFDYRCPHCKTSLPAVKNLLARDKNVRFAFIEYPILTPDSLMAAQAAVAARRQSGPKYMAFHFALMSSSGELPRERILEMARSVGLDIARLQRDMQDATVLASLKASSALAQRLHLDGTPSFVINNKVVVGELTDAELAALVRAAS